jgi:hypothetical protein
VCGLDSTGSGQGPVAGCCECGDEPSGSCATELDNESLREETIQRPRRIMQDGIRMDLRETGWGGGRGVDSVGSG